MAYDLKYGHVSVENQPGTRLGDDEPVIVFRAQDKLTVALLARYENLYAATQGDGFNPETSDFIRDLRKVREAFYDWQTHNRHLVKLPD